MNRRIRKAQLNQQWFKAQWLTTDKFLRLPEYKNLYNCGVQVRKQLIDQWLRQRGLWA